MPIIVPKLLYMRLSYKMFHSFILILLISSAGCSKNDTSYPPLERDPRIWIVSTVAGSGDHGYKNGPAQMAQFSFPNSIAVDNSGDLFVSDADNLAIRKISNGQVTTLSDMRTSNGNPLFGACMGIVLDKQGNVYNVQGGLIYKINQSGTGAVFAGSLTQSFKDGQDTAARFNAIERIARDVEGNFYLPDYDLQSNFCIRKVSPVGTVTTLSLKDNTGYRSGGRPTYSSGGPIALDREGNIYFTNYNIIKKADPQGNVSYVSGSGNYDLIDGTARYAQFSMISGMVCDSLGNLYVSDFRNGAIRKVGPDGSVNTIAGSADAGPGYKDGKGHLARFFRPMGIAIDKNGVLYVADYGNNRIRKLEYK